LTAGDATQFPTASGISRSRVPCGPSLNSAGNPVTSPRGSAILIFLIIEKFFPDFQLLARLGQELRNEQLENGGGDGWNSGFGFPNSLADK
jgi:hypothetical protein